MLKIIEGHETLRHICDRWTPDTQELDIFLHDVHSYAFVRKTGERAGSITYCPYCGVHIEKEERP